jgi:hypothetical protein
VTRTGKRCYPSCELRKGVYRLVRYMFKAADLQKWCKIDAIWRAQYQMLDVSETYNFNRRQMEKEADAAAASLKALSRSCIRQASQATLNAGPAPDQSRASEGTPEKSGAEKFSDATMASDFGRMSTNPQRETSQLTPGAHNLAVMVPGSDFVSHLRPG